MEAKSTGNKTIKLVENDRQLGELIYENMFFLSAEIKLTSSEVYQIKPVGLFQTSTTVTNNGNEIASLKMNWHGHMVFTFQDGQVFIFKAKSMFQAKYLIESKDKEKLIEYDPLFNWKKFNYNYDITYNKKPQDIRLVLLGVYAANYLTAIITGS